MAKKPTGAAGKSARAEKTNPATDKAASAKPSRAKPTAKQLEAGTHYKNKSGVFTLINGQLFNEAGGKTTAAAERKGGQLQRVKRKRAAD